MCGLVTNAKNSHSIRFLFHAHKTQPHNKVSSEWLKIGENIISVVMTRIVTENAKIVGKFFLSSYILCYVLFLLSSISSCEVVMIGIKFYVIASFSKLHLAEWYFGLSWSYEKKVHKGKNRCQNIFSGFFVCFTQRGRKD